MSWMLVPLRRYFDFSGRSRRREFWWFYLFVLIGILVLTPIDSALGLGGATTSYREVSDTGMAAGYNSSGGVLTALFGLAMLIPGLAVSVRRLHDVDKSGWWLLIGLIPFIGGLILLYHYVQPGTRGANRFGPDPLEGAAA